MSNGNENTDVRSVAATLVDWLVEVQGANDRGVLADLRSGAGLRYQDANRMHKHILPLTQGVSGYVKQTAYTVAALFALHPAHTSGVGNLGASLRAAEVHERRVQQLIDSDQAVLLGLLPGVFALLRRKGARVDFEQLVYDLFFYDHSENFVRVRWSESFWSSARPTGSNEELPEELIEEQPEETE